MGESGFVREKHLALASTDPSAPPIHLPSRGARILIFGGESGMLGHRLQELVRLLARRLAHHHLEASARLLGLRSDGGLRSLPSGDEEDPAESEGEPCSPKDKS